MSAIPPPPESGSQESEDNSNPTVVPPPTKTTEDDPQKTRQLPRQAKKNSAKVKAAKVQAELDKKKLTDMGVNPWNHPGGFYDAYIGKFTDKEGRALAR